MKNGVTGACFDYVEAKDDNLLKDTAVIGRNVEFLDAPDPKPVKLTILRLIMKGRKSTRMSSDGMSALGQKQTFEDASRMSALPPKADIVR